MNVDRRGLTKTENVFNEEGSHALSNSLASVRITEPLLNVFS